LRYAIPPPRKCDSTRGVHAKTTCHESTQIDHKTHEQNTNSVTSNIPGITEEVHKYINVTSRKGAPVAVTHSDISTEQRPTTYVEACKHKLNQETGRPIPVVSLSSRESSKSDSAAEFVGYKWHRNQRVRRYYVFGINKAKSSESSMRAFLERNGVKVTFVRYF